MFKFVADSSCDVDMLDGVKIETVPLTISTDERDFVDTMDMDVHEMLDYLLEYKGRSYTACPSTESWLKAYEGADELYVIAMTSHLSGTYNSACVARDIYLESNPDAKICIVDTLTTGPEMRLTIEKMIEWKKAGKSFEEISAGVKEYLDSTRLFFAFKSLHNFAQNGRVNKLVAAMVEKLNITITGTASEEGNIQPGQKIRGTKKVVNHLLDEIQKAGFKGGKLRICYIENEELARLVSDGLKALYPGLESQIYPARGLCSYYGERGGIIIGCEC
ncbi:MAG: DegV family EDD domain-containing protein [Lachnospiraceae bacterium]|nr:DegV family EDD domain-containing protein [Lachnospiraceae bacterium]